MDQDPRELEGVTLDEKIRELIFILNRLGIPTTGSCEGHTEYGSPAPWIKITPPDSDNGRTKEKIEKILSQFYNHHTPKKDARFIIDNANVGFWIHNGGIAYAHWRNKVNERAASHKRDEEVCESITRKDQELRAKIIPTYQKEIIFFTEFLQNKLPEKIDDGSSLRIG